MNTASAQSPEPGPLQLLESPESPRKRPGVPPLLGPCGAAVLRPSASQKPRSKRTSIPAGNRLQAFASPAATTTPALLRPPPPVRARASPPRTLPSPEVGGARRGGVHNGSLREPQKRLRTALGIVKRLRRECLLESLTFPVLWTGKRNYTLPPHKPIGLVSPATWGRHRGNGV